MPGRCRAVPPDAKDEQYGKPRHGNDAEPDDGRGDTKGFGAESQQGRTERSGAREQPRRTSSSASAPPAMIIRRSLLPPTATRATPATRDPAPNADISAPKPAASTFSTSRASSGAATGQLYPNVPTTASAPRTKRTAGVWMT